MHRTIAFLILAATTGCFPTYKHTVLDVAKAPLDAKRGELEVLTKDGGRIHYEAPYAVQPIPGGFEVRSNLLPSVEYEAAQIERFEATQFSVGGTVLVVAGVATAAYVAVAIGTIAAMASNGGGFIRFPNGFF